MSAAVIIVAIIALSVLLVVGLRKIADNFVRSSSSTVWTFDKDESSSLCYNQDIVLQIQRDQWAKAKLDIFGSEQAGFHGSDMEFYKKTFGVVDVTLPRNTKDRQKKQFTHLVYYRIFKNANDYIRSLLTEYAYVEDDHEREFISQNCYAPDQHCVHRYVHYLNPSTIKFQYVQQRQSRFIFTFIREPIDRFISAMTEIEYRLRGAETSRGARSNLPLQHPLGSQLRFQEFIKIILSSGGSKTLFRNMGKYEVIHIAPSLPTLILAEKVEGRPLKTFRIEEFDQNWHKLSRAVGIPKLNILQFNRSSAQKMMHPSSLDPFNTTLAAKSFLSHASADAFKRFGEKLRNRQTIPPGYSPQDYQHLSRTFLRSLCRIYITDYLCLNYSLPTDCEDMRTEVMEVVDDFRRFNAKSNILYVDTFSDLLRLVFPRFVVERLAVAACLFSPTPECEAAFINGANALDAVDRHEEL